MKRITVKVLAVLMTSVMLLGLGACSKESSKDTKAEETVDVEKEKALEVEEIIKGIGEVTLDSEDSITKAREAYDNADEKVQAKVSNLDVLESAEEEFDNLKALDISGKWSTEFYGYTLFYEFYTDGTMTSYSDTEGLTGYSGGYSFDGEYIHYDDGTDILLVKKDDDTLIMTATTSTSSMDFVLKKIG